MFIGGKDELSNKVKAFDYTPAETSEMKILKYLANGQWRDSATQKYIDVFDPSTGQAIARTPLCTREEVNRAIQSAQDAYPAWPHTPAIKRVQVLYGFGTSSTQNLDELTRLVVTENGKVWDEAKGDVLKAKEAVELACGAPSLMMGESTMDTLRLRHGTLSRAFGSVRRNRALQLSRP